MSKNENAKSMIERYIAEMEGWNDDRGVTANPDVGAWVTTHDGKTVYIVRINNMEEYYVARDVETGELVRVPFSQVQRYSG